MKPVTRSPIVSAVILLVLAGCAQRGLVSVLKPQMLPASMSAKSARTFNMPARLIAQNPRFNAARSQVLAQTHDGVFVADAESNSVEIFDSQTKVQIGSIGGLNGPEGLATGVSTGERDELFETDHVTQSIRVYQAPYMKRPSILNDSGYYPSGIYADKLGNVFVANICTGVSESCLGAGDTVEYKSGAGKPIALSGGPDHAFFVAENAAGDVWVDGQDSSYHGVIGYWKAGKGSFKGVNIALVFPGSLAFDLSSRLILDDQEGDPNGGSIVSVYPPHATRPLRSIIVQTNGDDIVAVALDAKGAKLYAPQYQTGTTTVISYATGKKVGTLPSTGTPDAAATVSGERP